MESLDFWEEKYLSDETPWDKGYAAPPLKAFLEDHPITGNVLVPGCGIGHDVRLLAAQGADVTGLDISPTAIYQARMKVREAGEEYLCGDLFALPSVMENRFDWVVEHTCFCAINPEMRSAYVQAIRDALKAGGQFLAVFFMEPDAEEGPPFGTTIEELDSLFGKDFQCLHDAVPGHSYPERAGRERLRHYRLRAKR